MMTCENCGCRVYNGNCINCHEVVYIRDQYLELDMDVPESILKECAEVENDN